MPHVYIVHLRKPKKGDLRFEPYWESGSFGVTGCHKENLLHHRTSPVRVGDRLAFMQGYNRQFRIVGLTPPLLDIATHHAGHRLEALWDLAYRPWRFEEAPILINNARASDFPRFATELKMGGRTTWVGAASSQFRTRATPLPLHLAAEMVQVCDAWRGARALSYIEAIQPAGTRWREQAKHEGWAVPHVRRTAYNRFLRPGAC